MESIPANLVAEQSTVNEPPAKTNNKTSSITNADQCQVIAARQSLNRVWTDYYQPGTLGEEGVTIPGSAFNFVIIGLLSFTAIKSQGNTRFPFQTHPQTIMVAITSLIMYGLVSAAEYVIIVVCRGPNVVYAVIARLGRKGCLYILVGSLASLFYL